MNKIYSINYYNNKNNNNNNDNIIAIIIINAKCIYLNYFTFVK